ncbi:MAG TPA: SgcJ/EcaC family oxidoreductase [Candidatus Limnocylindrales bacterium]|nr:SgcJ/EcaC family oxidoreductase [Candidatus Limnocylindrales bacterium]
MTDPEAGSAPLGSAPGSAPDLEWVEPEELEPADDPVGDAVRALNASYAAALAAANADALCALFEPDGAIVDPGGPDVVGHDGLREMSVYARERFTGVTFEIDVEWTKVDPLDGSTAYAAGTWRMGFVPRSGTGAGTAVRTHGRFAETWRRGVDGTWRLRRDLTLTREDG